MKDDIFSNAENKVLKIMAGKKLTLKEIADKFYKNSHTPINPSNTISSVVSRINKKTEYHKLPWFINGCGLGRAGRTVWVDKN